MPLYTYECESCGYRGAEIKSMHDPEWHSVMCPMCWGERTRRFGTPQVSVFKEFVTDAPGEKVYVSNRRALNELSRTHGIAPVTADEVKPYRRKPMEKLPSLAEAFHKKKAEMNDEAIGKQLKEMQVV